MIGSPTLSYEFGDSFGFEVFLPLASDALESSEFLFHDSTPVASDDIIGNRTHTRNTNAVRDDKYCPNSPGGDSQESRNRRLEHHRAEKGRNCSIVSDEGRKNSLMSEGSIGIETEDGYVGFFDDENIESYNKVESVLSVSHDKCKREHNSDDVENIVVEVQNCFASTLRRMESKNRDRGLRGRERGRGRRVEGQRHLCSAPESRAHSDEEGSLEDTECDLGRCEYDYNHDVGEHDGDNNDDIHKEIQPPTMRRSNQNYRTGNDEETRRKSVGLYIHIS